MDFLTARQNMIDCQLRPNKVVDDEILSRFMSVPRESFVDAASQDVAYSDTQVDIGHGRKLLTPMVQGRLLAALAPAETDQVLVVAAGSGYMAALVAPMVEHVIAVEENAYLVDVGKKAHSDLHLRNVKWVKDKPEKGCKAHAPYDCIILDAPADVLPDGLLQQLKEGGRVAGVIKGEDGLYQLSVAVKQGQALFVESLFETAGQALPNFKPTPGFVF